MTWSASPSSRRTASGGPTGIATATSRASAWRTIRTAAIAVAPVASPSSTSTAVRFLRSGSGRALR